MKRRIGLFLMGAVLTAAPALAGVVGSEHDLRGRAAFGTPQEVCKVCHVPHRSATATSALAPTGRVYAGGSLTIYGGTVGQPSNSSTVCLSCHDGTLAPLVGSTSTDYTHSHPFSTAYPNQTGFATATGGNVVSANGSLPLEGTTSDRLECGTCHNPHERGTSGNFLRIENTNSNLCLTCHQK